MGKKWGSNQDIHIGDIFICQEPASSNRPKYYQVTALRGSTQVALRAINSESYIQEEISEDGPLWHWRRRDRPVPGSFMKEGDFGFYKFKYRGKERLLNGESVTAWVLPTRAEEDRPRLQEVGYFGQKWGIWYERALPKDWEPLTPEQIKALEEYERACDEVHIRHMKGDEESPWPEYPI